MTKDEALKLALEALTYIYTETTADEDELIDQAITAIKEALAQPEQEPVGEVVNATDKAFECKFVKILPIGTKFYTTTPQRTWVGLTDDEMYEAVRTICKADSVARSLFDISKDEYRAIEAKLKEKNT